MKKCIAFSAIPGSREAWLPCMRRAHGEHALCRRHSDLVAGVMLGIFVSGIGDQTAKKINKKKKVRRAKAAPLKSQGAAARRARPPSAPGHKYGASISLRRSAKARRKKIPVRRSVASDE